MSGGDVVDRLHVGHLAKNVNGNDRLGSWGDSLLQLRRVQVERRGINIDEYRLGPEASDGAHRRKEGVRTRHDLITRADTESHERHEDGVGAGAHSDTELRPAIAGDLAL